MPFSVHLDDKTRRAIESLARKTGKKRNALINEAVREFVRTRTSAEWPEDVRAWIKSGRRARTPIPPFESYRSELGKQREHKL